MYGFNVYVDGDGVLADLEQGFFDLFGVPAHSMSDDAMWELIHTRPDFFDTLPVMPGAMDLWRVVEPYRPTILTGCPSTNFELHAAAKVSWFGRNTPGANVITCRAKNKPDHMLQKRDILLDDWIVNVRRWQKAGGFAIHHRSAEQSVAEFLAEVANRATGN